MAYGGEILGDAYVNVMAETGKLESGLARAMHMVESSITNISKTIAVGIGAALATAAGTAVASIWAWSKEEQTIMDLQSSITMLGASVDDLMPRYERIAMLIQQNTTIADDATRTAMAYGAALGAPVDRLDELAVAAAGLAARLKMSTQTAMMYLVRGLTSGRFDILTRYGLMIDKTKTKTEQFNQVLEFSNKGFSKQAEMANTISGRLSQLKNNLGDIMEKLGEKLAERFRLKEVINEISKQIFRVAQVFANVISALKPGTFELEGIAQWFDRIGKQILSIAYFLPTIADAFKTLKIDWGVMWDSFKIVMTGAGELLVTAITEGLKGLTWLFDYLAAYLGGAVEKALLKIPFVRGEIMSKYGKTGWISEEDIKDVEEAIDWKVRRDKKEKRSEVSLAQARESGDVIGRVADRFWNSLKENLGKGITTGVDFGKAWADAMSKAEYKYGMAYARGGGLEIPEFEKRPWEVGGGEAGAGAGGPQFFGFADFWKQMQKSTSAAKDSKNLDEIQKNTKKGVEQTEKFLGWLKTPPPSLVFGEL